MPAQFLPNRQKPIMSLQLGFHGKETLVSFTPKKWKSVLLISTMHCSKKIEENKKPEIINLYNSIKGGVDTFDQMAHNDTTAGKKRG